MNVFGGGKSFERGPRGPRGFRGKDSSIIDFCTWLPKTLLRNLQMHDERCCFIVQNLEKDVVRKGKQIMTWVSRSLSGLNLIAQKPSEEIEELEDRFAINFEKTRYISDYLELLPNGPHTYAFLCITFRIATDEEQVLISNYQKRTEKLGFFEVRVSSNDIILSTHSVEETIQHSSKIWTTLFIEVNTDDAIAHYRYNVNGIVGSFVGQENDMAMTGFSLGSRFDDTYFLNGQIASLETYDVESSTSLPDKVKEVIINNQTIY